MRTIAFTGGGTGGHIYPGLAVVSELKNRIDYKFVWIGSDSGMDRSIVESAGVDFIGVPSGKLRRYFSIRNFFDLFKIFAGFFTARSALKKLHPALLFSKGGFVSVPPCAAAASLGIPVFTHESDFSPGLATRLNLRWAKHVFVAYPDTIPFLPEPVRPRAMVVGNPVRDAFRSASAERGRRFLGVGPSERILLVLGGSQGAMQVNQLVLDALGELTAHYIVVHQTGPGFESDVPASISRYMPYPYIREELPDVEAAAELIVGRSGAGTVWEAATAGKPMILIPLSGSGTRGDQVENAGYFERLGAAIVLSGCEISGKNLAEAVARVAIDETLRRTMAEASRSIGSMNAAEAVTEAILQTVEGQSS